MRYSIDSWKRSLVKTVSYRVLIILLDFCAIFLLTHKYNVAIGFVVISNLYTSGGYFVHERIWDKIKFGKTHPKKKSGIK
ncbi:MAG: DUF2061 domain-containing protein [Nanoarchaeota archaeon]|nr:DUF2061 domain-containing protein [Nanoarchaeota archaeon]